MRPGDASGCGAPAAAALALLLAGCGGPGPDAALDAAIVPGADVLVRVDLRSLREAPVFAALGDGGTASDADADAEAGEAPGLDGRELLDITGLGAGDVVSLVLSADLDALDVAPGATAPDLGGVPAAAALRLAEPMDLDTLEKGILGAASGGPPPTVSRVEVRGRPALRVETGGPEASEAFLTSVAGGAILLGAPGRESLAGALGRAESGELAPVAAPLQGLMAAFPETAQARLGFAVPQKFRDGLKTYLEEPPPETAMFSGFAAPFEELQSLSLGVQAAEDLVVTLAGDLDVEQRAQQASAILGGLLAPMARSALATALDRKPAEVGDRLRVAAEGPTLEVTLRLTARDLAALGFSADRPAGGQ